MARNLRAAIEIEDHLGKAEIDAGQVEQVINALMINAREAMPSGGCVNVCAENVEIDENSGLPLEPGRYVKVAITDHGPGCPTDLRERSLIPISRPSLPQAVSAWRSAIRSFANMAAFSIWRTARREGADLRFLSPRGNRQGRERSASA